jgi:predicted branched-subunit amino acid permease
MATSAATIATIATTPAAERRPTRSAAAAGGLAMLPLVIGYMPFALVIGAAIAHHGDALAGWSGSWLVYGGSAQLAALRSIDDGVLVAVATGLLVNTRLLVYSASLSRHWRNQPRWFRLMAPALIIDPTWATAERYQEAGPSDREQRHHFIAAGLVLGVGWSATMAVGVLVGSRLDDVDLQIVVPLFLVALVGPMLRQREHRWVVTAAAIAAVLTREFPAGTGVLCAIAAGCIAGSLAPAQRSSTPPSEAAAADDTAGEVAP